MSHTLPLGNQKTDYPVTVWGLTGGIGAGKSTVAKLFAERGVPILDADQISRDISEEGGSAHSAIQTRFGTTDRAQLRRIIYESPDARRDLESILHPLIRAESLKRMQEVAGQNENREQKTLLIYEAALLFETQRYKDFSGLIVVEAPVEDRIARVTFRDQLLPGEVKKMIEAQTSDSERRKVADFVIVNDSTMDNLRHKVKEIHEAILYKPQVTP